MAAGDAFLRIQCLLILSYIVTQPTEDPTEQPTEGQYDLQAVTGL